MTRRMVKCQAPKDYRIDFMTLPKGLTPISTENARDIVDALDGLIKIRIRQSMGNDLPVLNEECELIKRRIVDYLLVSDGRIGVYQTGPRQ